MGRLWGFGVAFALLLFIVLLTVPHPASAQATTPTPEPTPSYQNGVPMSTGSDLLIERSVTLGDIGRITAFLLLGLVVFLNGFVSVSREMFPK